MQILIGDRVDSRENGTSIQSVVGHRIGRIGTSRWKPSIAFGPLGAEEEPENPTELITA